MGRAAVLGWDVRCSPSRRGALGGVLGSKGNQGGRQVRRVQKQTVAVLGACLALAACLIAGATASVARHTASVQVCVLLPDTKSSVRWVQFDAPDFAKALDRKSTRLNSS